MSTLFESRLIAGPVGDAAASEVVHAAHPTPQERPVVVIVPSPLVGEGFAELQRRRMGEGFLAANGPLTHPSSLHRRVALSHKGRGHNNCRFEAAATKKKSIVARVMGPFLWKSVAEMWSVPRR